MNLGLRISKNYNSKSYLNNNFINFAVVDLDKSKNYPANFVCLLSRIINTKKSQQSKFSSLFGDESKLIAKQLLTHALKSEADLENRKAIRDRLKLLDPKPIIHANCQVCKKPFELNKRRFKQHKMCYECYQKRIE